MGSIHGYEVASGLPLRRLSDAPGLRGRLRLERGPDSVLEQPGELTAWLEWTEAPGAAFALVRTANGLIAWDSAAGAFEIDPVAATIRVTAARFDEAWEHGVHTTIVPLLLSERGDLALHASAVAVGGRGILFCGPSGRGKSTLAWLASQLGHPVLTEDGAIVTADRTGPTVWPGARGVLVSDGAGRRRRLLELLAALEPAGPIPLASVCHLAERGPRLEVRGLTPPEALPLLVPSLIHAGGPESLRSSLAVLAPLVEHVALFRVSMPDSLAAAPEAAGALLAQVAP
jgi:hypothetical protein